MKDRLRKVQFKYLDYLFENMYGIKSKVYPDSVFFKKDDRVILELEKSGTLWVLHSIWSSIDNMFYYGYNETQKLIKEWIEQQLKREEITPYYLQQINRFWMEEKLKLDGIIPFHALHNWHTEEEIIPTMPNAPWPSLLEEQLKREEITPLLGHGIEMFQVDEQLKRGEITPMQSHVRLNIVVEEQLKLEELPPTNWYSLMEERLKREELKLNKDEKK